MMMPRFGGIEQQGEGDDKKEIVQQHGMHSKHNTHGVYG